MKYLGEGTKIQIITERPIDYIRCDSCRKKIIPHKECGAQNHYVHIHKYSNRWGDDSINHHEYNDYCSFCAKTVVLNYINSMDCTEELEIENKYLVPTNATYRGEVSSSDGYMLVSDDDNT